MIWSKAKQSVCVLLAAALVLALAAGCGAKKSGVIKIASKPMTEQFVLTEMLGLLIEKETDLKVEITKNIGGGTTNIHPALLKGDFDLYPEYTGTVWASVLKRTDIPDDETLYKELQEGYHQLGLKWVGLYGFNNTFTLAVREDLAEEQNIKTFSDVAKLSPALIFGGNYDFFEKPDGYPAMSAAYGMNFNNTVDIDMGLKYKALENKEIDVTNAFTTDAQLSVAKVRVLEDDKQFFHNYFCGTVVREDTLKAHPELEAVLQKMNGILTDQDMAALNYQVEVEERDERQVAQEFLTSKGLL